MYRLYIFRVLGWFLVFSLLNLQFALFATAGKGPFETDPPSAVSSLVSLKPSPSADEEADFTLPPTQGFSCVRIDQLPDLSMVATTLQSFPGYIGEEPSNEKIRLAQHLAAGVVALSYGFATTLLFLNDPGIGGLVAPGGSDGSLTPAQFSSFVVTSTVAGGLNVLQSYLLLEEQVQSQSDSLRAAFRQGPDSDYLKQVLTLFAGAGFIACMTVKPAFAYVTNVITDPQTLAAAGLVATVPFTFITLLKEVGNFGQFWFPTWEGGSAKIREIRGFGAEGKEAKQTLRHHLAHGLRRLIANPSETEALEKKFKEIQETLAPYLGVLRQKLSSLRNDKTPRDTQRKQEIKDLTTQIRQLKRLGDALVFKELFDFDADKAYLPETTHPWWYKAAKVTGAGVGLAAVPTILYGVSFVPEAAGVSEEGSLALGALGTAVIGPRMVMMGSRWLGRFASLVGNYNPIHNQPFIPENPSIYNTGSRKFNVAVDVVNMIASTLVALPAALVGGQGMGYGIGTALPEIPLNQQWWTLAPNMAIWGASEHNSTEHRVQKLGSRFKRWLGIQDLSQETKALFGDADAWVKTLSGSEAVRVLALVNTDVKNWFPTSSTVAPEDMGAALGSDSQRHSGSSASGGASTKDSPPKTGPGSRAPTPPSRSSSDGSGGGVSGAETASLPGIEEKNSVSSESDPSPEGGRSAAALEAQESRKGKHGKKPRSSAGDVELEVRGPSQTDSLPSTGEEPSRRRGPNGTKTFEMIVPTSPPQGQITQGHRGRSASLSATTPPAGRDLATQDAPTARERGASLQAPQGNVFMRGLRTLGNAFSSEGNGQESVLEKPLIEGRDTF